MKYKYFLNTISFILTVVDIISDVTLAVDYCVADNPWWCGLTWAFIAVPIITFFIIFIFFKSDRSSRLKHWKCTEICFESGPQLILQLYILALMDQDHASSTGKLYWFSLVAGRRPILV